MCAHVYRRQPAYVLCVGVICIQTVDTALYVSKTNVLWKNKMRSDLVAAAVGPQKKGLLARVQIFTEVWNSLRMEVANNCKYLHVEEALSAPGTPSTPGTPGCKRLLKVTWLSSS